MQNKYFGDKHDFYKYFLLNHISKYYSLGIHWCLVPDENSNDGNKIITNKEKDLDANLFCLLKESGNKDIKKIKPYFSNKIKYFDTVLQDYFLNSIYQKDAFDKLSKQDIIFFDPDNGLEVSSTNNKNKFKYLSYDVVGKFWENGNSMIIYQHLGRDRMSLEDKIGKITKLLKCNKIGNINIVRKENVDYIFIIQKKHYLLHDIIADFVNKNNGYKTIEL